MQFHNRQTTEGSDRTDSQQGGATARARSRETDDVLDAIEEGGVLRAEAPGLIEEVDRT